MTQDVIQSQIAYYRARAKVYDDWWYRRGHFDRGEDLNNQWFEEVAIATDALHIMQPVEQALELACGTGIWTEQLLKVSQHVTALDASPEVIAINRAKHNSDHVTYRQVDLFEWQTEDKYDLVAFGFWLSHVPPEKLDSFLDNVRQSVKAGGQLFMIDDSLKGRSTTSTVQPVDEADHIHRIRKLDDGHEYKIIKVFYEPDALVEKFAQHGFKAEVKTTPNYFIYATGVPQ